VTAPTLAANEPCWCGSGRRYKRCHRLADLDPARVAAEQARRERTASLVRPGRLSPRREVPASIPRPDYALDPKGRPTLRDSGKPKDDETIAKMRVACRAAAEVLAELGAAVAPGVTTDELDRIAHEGCLSRGGYPSPLGYGGSVMPYPKSLCTSVNEVICHGIPDSTVLKDGDIVNCDVTIFLDGVHGDTNATFLVGDVDEASRALVEVTRESLDVGIAAVHPGGRIRDIGRAIQKHAEGKGYGVVRAFVGHGVGRSFHCDPQVFHYDNPQARSRIETGMTFTIEPMITIGDWEHEMWDDGWTAVTRDRSRTAQFEHTLLVTDDGAEVLTHV